LDDAEVGPVHLFSQLGVAGQSLALGLDDVAQVVEPGFGDGVTELGEPPGVEGDVVVGEGDVAGAPALGVTDVRDDPLQWEGPEGPPVHLSHAAEVAGVGTAPTGLDQLQRVGAEVVARPEAQAPLRERDIGHLFERPTLVVDQGIVDPEGEAGHPLQGTALLQGVTELREGVVALPTDQEIEGGTVLRAQLVTHEGGVVAAQDGLDVGVGLFDDLGHPLGGGELEGHGAQGHHLGPLLRQHLGDRLGHPLALEDQVGDDHLVTGGPQAGGNQRARQAGGTPNVRPEVGHRIRHGEEHQAHR